MQLELAAALRRDGSMLVKLRQFHAPHRFCTFCLFACLCVFVCGGAVLGGGRWPVKGARPGRGRCGTDSNSSNTTHLLHDALHGAVEAVELLLLHRLLEVVHRLAHNLLHAADHVVDRLDDKLFELVDLPLGLVGATDAGAAEAFGVAALFVCLFVCLFVV